MKKFVTLGSNQSNLKAVFTATVNKAQMVRSPTHKSYMPSFRVEEEKRRRERRYKRHRRV